MLNNLSFHSLQIKSTALKGGGKYEENYVVENLHRISYVYWTVHHLDS